MKEFYQKTVTETMRELANQGYKANFQALQKDFIAYPSKKHYSPKELTVIKNIRFDGDTDPSDSSELFAIIAKDGVKGTMLISYGANHDFNDDLVREMRYDA